MNHTINIMRYNISQSDSQKNFCSQGIPNCCQNSCCCCYLFVHNNIIRKANRHYVSSIICPAQLSLPCCSQEVFLSSIICITDSNTAQHSDWKHSSKPGRKDRVHYTIYIRSTLPECLRCSQILR